MEGSAARIRESSLTLPSSIGTLKSTRMRTRLPLGSKSRTVCFCMRWAPGVLVGLTATGRSLQLASSSGAGAQPLTHERHEICDTARVPPLVVIPGDDLD